MNRFQTIKHFCLVFLMASNGSAYAATGTSPSVDVPITIASPPPSNGIACDIGPNYIGSIPAGAQAAGFTHCAVNLDFTQASLARLSNWLDCFGASSPLLYYPTDPTPPVNKCDSSHYAMVTDGGVQVFKASWLTSDGSQDNELNSASTAHTVFPAYVGFTIPNGQFVEQVWRLSSISQCSQNCLVFGPFEYPHSSDPNPFIEYDFDEIYSGPAGANHNIVANAIGSIAFPVYDPTNYHTYGFRVTADGNGNIAYCNYYSATVVNGLPSSAFHTCSTASRSGTGTQRQTVRVPWGPNPNDHTFFAAGLDMYMQRMTIWECPGWQGANEHSNIFTGAQCNGPLLTTAP